MRILMSYSTSPNALEKQYYNGFKAKGISVTTFNHSEFSHRKSILGKIIRRFYPQYFWNEANRKLLEIARFFKPDVLLIFKGLEIYPQTLLEVKKLGVKLVNYNPDHPFIFFSRGSGNQNVLNSIPFFDLQLTYSTQIASDFKIKYPNQNIEILPFGYSLNDADYEEISIESEIHRACFVGHADIDRVEIVKSILKQGLSIDIYGSGWLNFLKNSDPQLRIFSELRGLDYYRTLNRYRVQLNIFRGHNVDSHNMRSFEVPAAGGIMLAPDTIEHRQFYSQNSEVFLFNSSEEIPFYIKKILKLSPEEANEIRFNARKRSVSSGYDYESRTSLLLEKIHQIQFM